MSSNRKLNIVVIEDNQHMAEMIKDFLIEKFNGSEVSTFNTGEKALAEMMEEPDIIILDYQLDSQDPKALNGIQILMKIKKKFQTPVIFLTGQDKIDVAANTMKYGAVDYVIKNKESFHRLEISIENILKNSKLNKNIGSQKMLITGLAILSIILLGIIVWMKVS